MSFRDRVVLAVKTHKIPNYLVINFDQTGVHLVPASNRSFAVKGAQQVAIRFYKDKRQITALLAAAADGTLLPEQLIFQGKTKACHPKVISIV